jgi:porphobilinogen synthase
LFLALPKPGGGRISSWMNLPLRLRRNRASAARRELVRETRLHPSDLIWPLFLQPEGEPTPIAAMPGVWRWNPSDLLERAEEARAWGLHALAIFPCVPPAQKDALGTYGLCEDNFLLQTLTSLKANFPELVLIADVALDPYTSHGHDGLLSEDGKDVENDATVEVLEKLAVLLARAGADVVAPSDMMDGRVGAIRQALDEAQFTQTIILSYAAKFASAYYGPFREAVGSKIGRDAISKATYQLDPANAREAQREVELDWAEGADWVMVKPAGPYLDILREVATVAPGPVAAYQVSGEYAQIHAAARAGWLDYHRTRDESLLAIKRAGADLILTYFAGEWAREFTTGQRSE